MYSMNVDKIENIDQLIQLPAGYKIINHTVKRLTAPGENYGSLMLSVDLTVSTPSGTQEIHTVAKMVPPNEFIQKVFNTQVTFRNEIAFYKNIVPALQNFQKESGTEKVIDFTPKYYGSRLNLTGGSNVDADAALVLDNLKIQNYVTLERTAGLDLDVATLILTDLAHLHAVPLALKLQKLDIFEKQIRPHLSPWKLPKDSHKLMREKLTSIVDEIGEIRHLKDRILAGFDKQMVPREPREPFATVVHNDCWTNNCLVKIEGNNAVKNKLVDYQVLEYGSPAKDVVFFLYSSVKSEIVADKYDHLLGIYYKKFISILEDLKCEVANFSFEAFLQEIDFEAVNSQFGHVTFMLFPIFAVKKDVKEISEFTAENMLPQEVTNLHKEKLVFVVKEFAKRHWI